MASAQVLTRQKYSPIEEVSIKHLPQIKSPLSQVIFPDCPSPLSMTRPEIQRLGSSTSSSKSAKSLEVCVFMKDGSVHELYLENAWTEHASELLLKVEDCLAIPPEAKDMFALWITSPLLQLQLKPHHVPFKLCRQWHDLLDKFTTATDEQKAVDEPVVCYQRNAFLCKEREMEMFSNTKILVWLFSEAKSNVLTGNYPCDGEDYEYLGGILSWLAHGKYDPEIHPTGFLKSNLTEYVPTCMYREGDRWSWLKGKTATAAAGIVEQRLFRQWDQISEKVQTKTEAMQLFMKFCWKLPFYGCVFFSGQIEKVSSGIHLRDCPDRPVRVGINRDGIFIMDSCKQELLLGRMFDSISWEYTEPAKGKPNCLPCLWLEFDLDQGPQKCSKLLQIFSKQSVMMNAMIEACVEELNKKDRAITPPPVSEKKSVVGGLLRVAIETSAPVLIGMPVKEPKTSLCAKTNRLCLSTYSDNGELIESKCKVKRPFTFPSIFRL
ncbi:putative FERM domain-containing protein FRMD8P1 isoform X2 [Apostichopus japonicus]|uniref:putative FERM domain-containing protein FRMD8P1 isoform X2 n=1 Tax=Stichopus japonicus TaxID=307972 RepID=UPI003AB808EC